MVAVSVTIRREVYEAPLFVIPVKADAPGVLIMLPRWGEVTSARNSEGAVWCLCMCVFLTRISW